MRKRPIELLSTDEIRAMLRHCGRGPCADRNRAAIVLMWRSGLRVSELCDLTSECVDLEDLRVQVLAGKGGRSRSLGLDPEAAAVIRVWVMQRKQMAGDWLLCTLRGERVPRRYFNHALSRIARRAGVAKRVHPHVLRHVFAVGLVREGVHIEHIRRLLGHRTLQATVIYLEGLGMDETLALIRSREWR